MCHHSTIPLAVDTTAPGGGREKEIKTSVCLNKGSGVVVGVGGRKHGPACLVDVYFVTEVMKEPE